jgi:hypothetical protein
MRHQHQNTFKASTLVLFAFLVSGCGRIDFSLTDLRPKLPISKPSAQGVEVVSGSSVGKKTLLNGYTVDASVGAVRDKLETRTPNGYTIYHGVKGAIVSDEAQ